MTSVGYMAKRVSMKPDFLKAPNVVDVYSVSSCVSEDFANYINFWMHNGYWFFDSPELIRSVSTKNNIDLAGTRLFYYEVHELEFDGSGWSTFLPEASFATNVVPPKHKNLEGFDVVTFYVKTSPECSPLSCNSMAAELRVNSHCLFETFAEAESHLKRGSFRHCEPGPCRIFAVYSVDWS